MLWLSYHPPYTTEKYFSTFVIDFSLSEPADKIATDAVQLATNVWSTAINVLWDCSSLRQQLLETHQSVIFKENEQWRNHSWMLQMTVYWNIILWQWIIRKQPTSTKFYLTATNFKFFVFQYVSAIECSIAHSTNKLPNSYFIPW